MSLEFSKPFVTSAINVLSTVAGICPRKKEPYTRGDSTPGNSGDISAVIGLTGDAEGWVAVSFLKAAALKVVSNILGETKTLLDNDVQDAVGEIVNMIAGGAKAEFSQSGISFKLAIPTIIVGENHILTRKRDVNCVVLPFEIEEGCFTVELCLKILKDETAKAPAA